MKITLCILLLLFVDTTFAYDNNRDAEKDAIQAIATATYKQTGTEENINRFIEEKIIPREHKELLGRITLIVNTLITQRVETTWSF